MKCKYKIEIENVLSGILFNQRELLSIASMSAHFIILNFACYVLSGQRMKISQLYSTLIYLNHTGADPIWQGGSLLFMTYL